MKKFLLFTLISALLATSMTSCKIEPEKSEVLESGKDDFVIYDDGETVICWKFSTAATYMGDPESWRYDEYYDGELKFYIETELRTQKSSSYELLFLREKLSICKKLLL